MKRIVSRTTAMLLVLALFLSFTACAPSFKEPSAYADLPEYYNEGTDYPMNFLEIALDTISPTEKGYFTFNDTRLMFFDKETCVASVVCNRPECTHQDETCPAVFERGHSQFLQYYEDKLYVAANEYDANRVYSCWLYEVNTSNCTRTKLCQLPYGINDAVTYMMHRGYLYITAYRTTDVSGAKVVLERVPLNKLTEKSLEPEFLYERESMGFGKPYIFGNHFMFQYTEAAEKGYKWNWIDINLQTFEAKEVVLSDMTEGAYLIFERECEDRLIATYVDPNADQNGSRELIYYAYDPSSGQFESFVTMPDRGEGIYDFFSWDGENFLACYFDTTSMAEDFPGSPQEMRILNADLETVKRVPLDYRMLGYLTGDAEFSFFESFDDNGFYLYVIDKRGEEMQVIKVFE